MRKEEDKMINEAYDLVKRFQKMAEQPISEFPQQLSPERCNIRCKWMREEIEEFENSNTVYEQADAIVDLLYYALGALVEMGVKPDKLFMLVHEYNVKKIAGGQCDEDGKIMKPCGWEHPDREIKEIIDVMMQEKEVSVEKIEVQNIEKNKVVSDIMEQAARCVSEKGNITELEKIQIEGTKDIGIIVSFMVSVAAGVFIEAMKYVIKRIKMRGDYNGDDIIKIGNKVYRLYEIENYEEE